MNRSFSQNVTVIETKKKRGEGSCCEEMQRESLLCFALLSYSRGIVRLNTNRKDPVWNNKGNILGGMGLKDQGYRTALNSEAVWLPRLAGL